MTTVQHALKEYFTVRRWFLHHVLLGLLLWAVLGAAAMWLVTDRYFEKDAEAYIIQAGGDVENDLDFTSQGGEVLKAAPVVKTTTVKTTAPKTR